MRPGRKATRWLAATLPGPGHNAAALAILDAVPPGGIAGNRCGPRPPNGSPEGPSGQATKWRAAWTSGAPTRWPWLGWAEVQPRSGVDFQRTGSPPRSGVDFQHARSPPQSGVAMNTRGARSSWDA